MKANFLYTLTFFCSMVVTTIFGILIKRIVLPEIIGAFVFVNSIIVIFNLPCSVLRNAVDRLVPKYLGLNNEQSAYDIASISLSTLITISIFESILLFLIGLFYKNDFWQYYAFIIVAISFFFSSISTFFLIYLKSLNKIKIAAYLLLISPSLEPIFYLLVLLYKNIGYYIRSLLIGVCASILIIYYSVKQISWSKITPFSYKFKNIFSNSLFKEIIRTGSLLLFYSFLFQLLFVIDKYFVKFLEGNTILAFYDFAVSGTAKIVMIFVAFIESFSPRIYRNFAVNKNQNYLFDKLTYLILMISYIVSFIIYSYVDYFVKLILPNYIQSVPYFKIFAFMIMPLSQYYIGYIIAVGKNRIAPLIKSISILLMINVFLDWVLYKFFGIPGIAWATLICFFLEYIIVSIVVFQTYRLCYLTMLFLPVLILNCFLLSYNIQIAYIYLLMVILIFIYFLYSLKNSLKNCVK